MKPSLMLFEPVLEGSGFIASLNKAKGWKRSIRLQGGFWQGSCTLTGQPEELVGPFYQWLGYHLQERTGGVVTWEGMVYELELSIGGARRRRSLDDMYNAVSVTYTTQEGQSTNLVENGGFETAGGGGADVFAFWTESAAGVAAATSPVYAGTYSCEITGDGVVEASGHHTNRYVYQDLRLIPASQYRLQVQANAGSDGKKASYAIYDPAETAYIMGPLETHWKENSWKGKGSNPWKAPDTGIVRIYLYPPKSSGDAYYWDDVEVVEYNEAIYETGFDTEDQSIARYGRRELVALMDQFPKATATAHRTRILGENAYPWPRPVSLGRTGAEAELTITACGYIHTANWLYLTEGDGDHHDLDDWISAILGSETGLIDAHGGDGTTEDAGDCQFLYAGAIATNTLQVRQATYIRERCWDRLQELAGLGDSSGDPYRIRCAAGRRVHYEALSPTPRYYLRRGGVYDRLGAKAAANPYLLRPGVVRDLDFPAARAERGSFLQDARDSIVEEVEVDGEGQVTLKTALYSEAELISRQLEELASKEGLGFD